MTIVGVSGNIIDDWYSRRNGPMAYVSMPQRPSYIINLVARTAGDPTLLSTELRQVLRSIDPAQPPVHVMAMRAMLDDRTIGLQMIGAVMGALGVLALLLASTGLYSLMSYQVTQRRHEIGVRMALGASRGGIVQLTIHRGWWLTIAGLAAGLAMVVPLAGVLRSVMFGVVTAGATSLRRHRRRDWPRRDRGEHHPGTPGTGVEAVVALRSE